MDFSRWFCHSTLRCLWLYTDLACFSNIGWWQQSHTSFFKSDSATALRAANIYWPLPFNKLVTTTSLHLNGFLKANLPLHSAQSTFSEVSNNNIPNSSSVLLYVLRDHKNYQGGGAQVSLIGFHTATDNTTTPRWVFKGDSATALRAVYWPCPFQWGWWQQHPNISVGFPRRFCHCPLSRQ